MNFYRYAHLKIDISSVHFSSIRIYLPWYNSPLPLAVWEQLDPTPPGLESIKKSSTLKSSTLRSSTQEDSTQESYTQEGSTQEISKLFTWAERGRVW